MKYEVNINAKNEQELQEACAKYINELGVKDLVELAYTNAIYLQGEEGDYRLAIMTLGFEDDMAMREAFGDWYYLATAADTCGVTDWLGLDDDTQRKCDEAWEDGEMTSEMESQIAEAARADLLASVRMGLSNELDNMMMMKMVREEKRLALQE